jgi:hypothetical protein
MIARSHYETKFYGVILHGIYFQWKISYVLRWLSHMMGTSLNIVHTYGVE